MVQDVPKPRHKPGSRCVEAAMFSVDKVPEDMQEIEEGKLDERLAK